MSYFITGHMKENKMFKEFIPKMLADVIGHDMMKHGDFDIHLPKGKLTNLQPEMTVRFKGQNGAGDDETTLSTQGYRLPHNSSSHFIKDVSK